MQLLEVVKMALRRCIKLIVTCLFLSICGLFLIRNLLFSKLTGYRNLELHDGKELDTVNAPEDIILKKLLLKLNLEEMQETEKSETLQRHVESITLKPDTKRQLNVNSTHLKIPSMSGMNFLLEDKSTCDIRNLALLLIIHSAPTHFDRRKTTRETWANSSSFTSLAVVRTIFLFGRPKNSTLQTLLQQEFLDFRDIVQGNFDDSYQNLSLNSLYGFKWVTENCANAKVIVKSDDDIVVNMYKFLHLVKPFLEKTKEVLCFKMTAEIFRDKASKNYVGENVFPGMEEFPWYCEGKFVMMTSDVIPILLQSASITPMFWIEDVYWYGLVMSNIPNLTHNQINWGTEIETDTENAITCLRTASDCNFFITWAQSTNDMAKIWLLMYLYDKDTYVDAMSKETIKIG